jgi:DNA-directed DNA polymerase III PolC
MDPFVHLHVHSNFSMMRGASSAEALCETAKKAGFSTLALTDTNGFYGLIHFLEAARRHGLRPILGAHLQTKNGSAVILAKTPTGYELLSDLITRCHLRENFSLLEEFPASPENLAVLSTDPNLLKALRERADCWVEAVAGPDSRKILKLAKELGIPPIASNTVYFADPGDYPLHRLLRAIDLNRTLSDLPPEEVARPDQWLKSSTQMAVHFPDCPEALTNAAKLAGQCHTAWDHSRTIFPHYRDRRDDHFALLLNLCRIGIEWRYGATNAVVAKRLEEELDLIRAKGYVDYFLVVADIVRRRPIHCGRGSAAASLVSYLLGITHVDPIRHNLLFGRFLNPQRQDHPDIDVDFPWDERDDLLQELVSHYGAGRLASVANHVGFRSRAAVREVAKVYGVPAAEIKQVTRRMSFWTDPARIQERFKNHPKFHNFPLDPPWPEIFQLASRLEPIPRHLSVHCGGVILVPDRVSRYVPVERSANGNQIIQWEKEQAEKAGLVKIDLLGNRSLAVIRDALAAVAKNTGNFLDYARFNPLDDPATVELIRRGDTMGVFYVESPAMRQLQQKTRRGDFEHLVIHSSIIRPAANRYIQEYIRRLHGVPYQPLHPSLRETLAETYGILVYQEQVVQVAMILADFDWAEADGLRKVLSKKSTRQLASYQQHFREGCLRKGIAREIQDAIWDMFTSFAGYSFCKPHSASYALVSYKSAYLKAHYPAEFMAAVLNNGGGYYSTFAYISEARRMALEVLGPDINQSDWGYLGKQKTIRIGLKQLQNIRQATVENILRQRNEQGPYRSLENLLARVNFTPADAAVLAKSGALDCLAGGLNRPRLLWVLEAMLNCRAQTKGIYAGKSGQMNLFSRRTMIPPPSLPDLSAQQKWRQEIETLGFILSVHPLEMFKPSPHALPFPVAAASDLARQVGRRVWLWGWPITRKEVVTREGEPMEFVSFEDQSAMYETVFFPKAFKRFCQHLDVDRAYLLYGRVESEFDTPSLTVEQLRPVAANA